MMWQTLGIPPTTDPAVIRRAYVVLLRAMDVDREPAAFIRLREAYESALAACSIPDTPRFVYTMDDADAPDAVFHEWVDDEAVEAEPDSHAVLAAVLADSGVDDAWATYNRLLASGEIGLNEQQPLAAMLVRTALDDARVSTDLFQAMAAQLGPEDTFPDHLTVLRNDAAARTSAHRWLGAVSADADRRAFGKKKFAVRAARRFLGQRTRLGQSSKNLNALTLLLDEYELHKPWIATRVDDDDITRLRERLRRAVVWRSRKDHVWAGFGVLMFLFLVLDLLYILIFGEWGAAQP